MAVLNPKPLSLANSKTASLSDALKPGPYRRWRASVYCRLLKKNETNALTPPGSERIRKAGLQRPGLFLSDWWISLFG